MRDQADLDCRGGEVGYHHHDGGRYPWGCRGSCLTILNLEWDMMKGLIGGAEKALLLKDDHYVQGRAARVVHSSIFEVGEKGGVGLSVEV